MNGDGFSAESACEITSWRQLDAIREDVSLQYKLMNDLTGASFEYDLFASPTANASLGWTPLSGPCEDGGMGCTYPGFSGTLDGQGFTIQALTVNRPDDEVGLFRTVDGGTVRHLILTNVSIRGNTAGGIAGFGYTALIERVQVSGTVVGTHHAGGILGASSFNSVLRQVANHATVEGEGDVGGIAGRMDTGLTLQDSYSAGTIIGLIDGATEYVGGIVGLVVIDGTGPTQISRVYTTSPVSSMWTVGAVFGEVRNAGGTFTSILWNPTDSYFGAGIGNSDGNTEAAAGLIQSTPTAMKRLSTYAALGWDFQCETTNGTDSIWGIQYSQDYPKLTGLGFTQTCVAEVAIQAGNNQRAMNGTAVAIAPSVVVRDASAQPIEGVELVFEVTGGGGTVDPTTVQLSDAGGMVTVTEWTLGATSGTNTLTATVEGVTPATITATGTTCPLGMVGDGLSTGTACQITSWRELDALRLRLDLNYQLENDLTPSTPGYATFASATANSDTGWLPIRGACDELDELDELDEFEGWSECISYFPFTGRLDGQGNRIIGLNSNQTTEAGLFLSLHSAGIQRLVLEDLELTGSVVGGISAYSVGSLFDRVSVAGTLQGDQDVGGIAGRLQGRSVVERVRVSAAISGNSSIGGIAGRMETGGLIQDTYSTGSVSGTSYVGGIVGDLISSDTETYVRRTYSVSAVSGTTEVGALFGGVRGPSGTYTANVWNPTESTVAVGIGYLENNSTAAPGAIESTQTLMRRLSTYTALGWDFQCETTNGGQNFWGIAYSQSTPQLSAFGFEQTCVASVALNAGDAQRAMNATAVAIPPTVIVRDASEQPIQGVEVVFAVASGDGSVDPATPIVTLETGLASPTSWTLGPASGANTLTATVAGIPPVTFTATGTTCPNGMLGDGLAPETACQITSWRELDALRLRVDLNYQLENDLTPDSPEYVTFAGPTANDNTGWNPIQGPCTFAEHGICFNYAAFSGQFRGQGNSIQNLIINRPTSDYVGLFVSTGNAYINNLNITNSQISGLRGGILAALSSNTLFENIFISGTMQGDEEVGGLVGQLMNNSIVRRVSAEVQVSGRASIGGIIGTLTTNGTIEDSYIKGSVIGTPGISQVIGGIVGNVVSIYNDTYLRRTYSTATVSGHSFVGALFGRVHGDLGSYTGNVWNPTDATVAVGVGWFDDNTTAAAGVIQSTQTLMRRLSTYTALGWDFQCETANGSANTWGIAYSQSTPQLSAFGFEQTCVASVAMVSGNAQRELAGSNVPLLPTVVVRDAGNLPIQGVEVVYAVTGGGGSVSPTVAITTETGEGTPSSWTLGAVPGVNTLTATVAGQDAITFSSEGTPCPVGMTGNGTSTATACQITSWRELNAVRQAVSLHYALQNSLTPESPEYALFAGPTANANQGWNPIAISPRFSGHFNGQNFSIDGLTMNRPLAAGGLFSQITDATVENLTLSNVNLTASGVGGVAFLAIRSTIRNVRVAGTLHASDRAGGIAAFTAGANTLDQVGFEGTILNTTEVQDYALGGLVGRAEVSLILRDSYAIGTVGGPTTGQTTGGLIGELSGFETVLIERNFSGVAVSSTVRRGAVIGTIQGTIGTYTQNLWNPTDATVTAAIAAGEHPAATAGMIESSAAAMRLPETYTALGWDFQCERTNGTNQIWGVIPGTEYPRLRSHGFVQDCDLNTAFPGPHIGWRMMGAPAQGITYAQLLSGVWTQGFPGASFSGGSPNVYWFNEATSAFVAPTHASNIVGSGVSEGFNNAGRGFIAYLFEDDDLDGTPDGWPKAFQIQGAPFIGDVEASFSETDLNAELYGWHLAANPYPFPIRWTSLVAANALDNIIPAIFVQDPNVNAGLGGYRVHYGFDVPGLPGSIAHSGIIPPFQGFWVRTAGGGRPGTITFREAYETSGGTLYDAPISPTYVALSVAGEGEEASAMLLLAPAGEEAGTTLPVPLRQPSLRFGFERDETAPPDVFRTLALNEGQSYELPLAFSAFKSGTYTLSLHLPEDVRDGFTVEVRDLFSGTVHRFAEGEPYQFTYSAPPKARTSPQQEAATFSTLAAGPPAPETPRFTLHLISGSATSSEPLQTHPATTNLLPNYPNPVLNTTRISFSLAAQEHVTLGVYDVMGRLVEVLFSGVREAGMHSLNWNASSYPPGVYLYRLEAGGQRITRSLSVTR